MCVICFYQSLCNICLVGGFSSLSSDATMTFDIDVANVQASQVNLTFISNIIHCYTLNCTIRKVSNGTEREIAVSISSKSVIVPDLVPRTAYEFNCNATSLNEVVASRSGVFTTG